MAQALYLDSATPSAPVRRVSIRPATAQSAAFIIVHFRDQSAAHQGFQALPEKLAQDPRTQLDLASPMPTLRYPVM